MPPELLGGLHRKTHAQNVEPDLTAEQDRARALKNAWIARWPY